MKTSKSKGDKVKDLAEEPAGNGLETAYALLLASAPDNKARQQLEVIIRELRTNAEAATWLADRLLQAVLVSLLSADRSLRDHAASLDVPLGEPKEQLAA